MNCTQCEDSGYIFDTYHACDKCDLGKPIQHEYNEVEAAKCAGVICGYPESFTVTKMIGINTITATYPIEINTFKNIEDYKDR